MFFNEVRNIMFNGIVEAIGTIHKINHTHGSVDFSISNPNDLDDLFVGASVSVNGVCLTVTSFSKCEFQVTAVPETLRVTNLSSLKQGDQVNLERAMKADSRIGGHYVQGHVDTIGEILEIASEGNALLVKIGVTPKITKYLVKKGYVGLDGMSITVIDVDQNWFTVTFIPQTQMATIMGHYQVGTKINIEVDMLGKYVERMLGAHIPCNPI
jgi:riboflavin synthase